MVARLAEAYRSSILVPCTACEYCIPCPAGVNIPQNFAILNTVSMERSRLMRWMIRRGHGRLANSREKVDKENPNGNASLCVACGKCPEKCSQQINIPEELVKVHAILGERERVSKHYS